MTLRDLFLPARLFALLPALLLLSFSHYALAGVTDWAVSDGGRMRVVSLPQAKDGRIEAVLQIELSPGWITYWREPGESGIPPRIDPDQTSRARLAAMDFPVPKRIENGPLTDIGYDRSVAIPFTLAADAGAGEIALSAFIGLCRNICIPFQADFILRRNTGLVATPQEEEALLAARAALPQPPSEDFTVIGFSLVADGKSLAVEMRLPENAADDSEIFVTGPPGFAFWQPREVKRDGRKLSFSMQLDGLPQGWPGQGKSFGLLVKAGARAMETRLEF